MILCFVMLFQNVNAQTIHECGSDLSEQASTYEHLQNKSIWHQYSRRTTPYIIPLKFHIIGANNGAFAIDSVLVFDELSRVNNIYIDGNIQFQHCGIVNYINSNEHLTFIKNTHEDLCDIHDVQDAINVYFAPNVERQDGDGICGYAYNYDIKPRVIMDNGCSTNGSTLAHELGHSLSLLHTHSTFWGDELVDGSNCHSAGDQLCDTPADPRLSSTVVNSSCAYTGSETDGNNQSYAPDTRNIMSYSRKNCRNRFSEEQLLQMEAFHSVNYDLLTCLYGMSSISQTIVRQSPSITPNPCTSHFQINHISAESNINIFSTSYTLIARYKIKENHEFYEVPFNYVPVGLYFIEISTPEGQFYMKIIKAQ